MIRSAESMSIFGVAGPPPVSQVFSAGQNRDNGQFKPETSNSGVSTLPIVKTVLNFPNSAYYQLDTVLAEAMIYGRI